MIRFLVVLLALNSCSGDFQRLSLYEYQKGVLEYFVDTGFLDYSFLQRWERLASKQTLTRVENRRMLGFHTRINNAARRYQKEYGLIQTGIVDGKIIEKVFGAEHAVGMFDGLF
jgi:hypothetical protein